MRRFVRLLIWLALLLAALVALGLWSGIRPPPAPPVVRVPLEGQVDLILVEKAARRLTVFRDGEPLRTYPVVLGFAPTGDKVRQGDGKTPEGRFRIDRRNDRSRFHLSLGLDYPQADDRARAAAGGYDPGGDIMIHGQPNALFGKATLTRDWTAGCIALADTDIEELWRVTRVGTEVEIRP
ncbi:L,D-transpeptidase [Frigidibacter sp. RF13]|nr:L,D-transpeptidase [Frigidibacter sp. RF13]